MASFIGGKRSNLLKGEMGRALKVKDSALALVGVNVR